MNSAVEKIAPVDRSKTCPLLLRIFYNIHRHHRGGEFARGRVPDDCEFQIHTWLDCTLNELTILLGEVIEEARVNNTILSFSVVYPDKNGLMQVRPIGKTCVGRPKRDDFKTLEALRFEIGDYLDVAVIKQRGRPF